MDGCWDIFLFFFLSEFCAFSDCGCWLVGWLARLSLSFFVNWLFSVIYFGYGELYVYQFLFLLLSG